MPPYKAIVVGFFAAYSAQVACSASPGNNKTRSEQAFTVFVTTELRGTVEPCGCNSDPLGDIARTAEVIATARGEGQPVLVLDGGSLLYSEPSVPEYLAGQEALKSDLISDIVVGRLGAAAIGLGPYDLGAGPAKVRPARHAVNLDAGSGIATEEPKVIEVGKAKVGVFGVVSPTALAPLGIAASDPAAAAKSAAATLRKQGAQLVIALAHMTRREAVSVAKAAAGIDLMLVGQNAPEPGDIEQAATRVGDTYLFAPANRGQIISRLDVTLRGAGPLVDAVGETRAAADIARIGERMAKLKKNLVAWKADPSADSKFISGKERELAELGKRKKVLESSPLEKPDRGSFFTLSQIAIRKGLPCNKAIQDAKMAYDKAAGAANVKAAANLKPAPLPAGKPGYAGIAECADCHDEAVAFWQKTRHHLAWETLVKVGKQLDYECISCHVTGWDEPGGSTLAKNQTLRDVQCEVCHGPGSIHVAEDGSEEPSTLVLTTPEKVCKTCHNSEHSDTFQYEAYLRDVTGKGHGEEFRKKLGDGPTGHELRSAALEKAGRNLGAGCVK